MKSTYLVAAALIAVGLAACEKEAPKAPPPAPKVEAPKPAPAPAVEAPKPTDTAPAAAAPATTAPAATTPAGTTTPAGPVDPKASKETGGGAPK